MRSLARALAALGLCSLASAQTPQPQSDSALEARVESLLSKLTIDEKLGLIGGVNEMYIRPVPRLGIPAVRMADGPLGVRNYGRSTAYPATAALAATWDLGLARDFGLALGSDARARAVGILLAPAVNIQRVPLNGRNFEYLSEDPYLAGRMAFQIVSGIQERNVAATVKHFALNNQETDRDTIDVRIGQRALREVYLPAFRAGVEEGHAWAVMDAYNKVNGTYCTANDLLNNRILKGEWHFPGIVMSDWGATHDTLGAATGGLDLEMPSATFMTGAALKPLLASGTLPQSVIDEKVRRILRLEAAHGWLDSPLEESGPKDDPHSDAVALQIAREGIVLLKNEGNALPFLPKRTRKLVVIGPNAVNNPAGGGSSHVDPFRFVSAAEGIRKAAGSKVHVDVIEGTGPAFLDRNASRSSYAAPLRFEWLDQSTGADRVLSRQEERVIDFDGRAPRFEGVDPQKLGARWTARITAATSGPKVFLVRNQGNVSVKLDGREILSSWFNTGETLSHCENLEQGSSHELEVTVKFDMYGPTAVRFAWGDQPAILSAEDRERIKAADAAVVCVGYNLMLEGEGSDRSFALPTGQPELIREVAAINPRTVVVVNSGGPVATADWIDKVPAVVLAWFPGQEGGRALGEILNGLVSPSGKLPVTFGQKEEDYPSFGNYPGKDGSVSYDEGLLPGYRGFDAHGRKPLFAFGYGLSYSSFRYENLRIDARPDGTFAVIFDVANNGTVEADEIAEVYVSPPVPSRVPRAVRELRGFGRVHLGVEQSATATIILGRDAFEYWDEAKGSWSVEPGRYTVAVGSSSRSLQVTTSLDVP